MFKPLLAGILLLVVVLVPRGVFAEVKAEGDAPTESKKSHGHVEFSVSVGADDAHDAHHVLEEKYGRENVIEQHNGAPLDPKADLAIWSLVVFFVFVGVLTKFAWKPLAAGLDSRETKIRQDIADAEEARKKTEQMLAEHVAKLDAVQDEVREIIAEARRDAEHTKQEIVTQAQSEAEATQKRALDAIDRARDQALDELFATMSNTVAQATEYVVGRSLTGDDQGRLIDEALSQFSAQSN
jgi:F-type H+-transporting ATPase subunit b